MIALLTYVHVYIRVHISAAGGGTPAKYTLARGTPPPGRSQKLRPTFRKAISAANWGTCFTCVRKDNLCVRKKQVIAVGYMFIFPTCPEGGICIFEHARGGDPGDGKQSQSPPSSVDVRPKRQSLSPPCQIPAQSRVRPLACGHCPTHLRTRVHISAENPYYKKGLL